MNSIHINLKVSINNNYLILITLAAFIFSLEDNDTHVRHIIKQIVFIVIIFINKIM